MKTSKLVVSSLMSLAFSVAAHALPPVCPDFSSGGSTTPVCNFIITFNGDGSITTGGPGGTYDGADDTLVGVVNNTSAPISSFNLSSSSLDIFGFDGDGIDGYGSAGNASDNTGYGGVDAYFTNISANSFSGTVNFIKAIAANGGTQYFSLEEAINVSAPPVISGPVGGGATPEPSSLILLGTGVLGMVGAARRKLMA